MSNISYFDTKADALNKLSTSKNKILCNRNITKYFLLKDYQSFLKLEECIESNSIGTHAVFNFCLENNFERITYSQAFDILRECNHNKKKKGS